MPVVQWCQSCGQINAGKNIFSGFCLNQGAGVKTNRMLIFQNGVCGGGGDQNIFQQFNRSYSFIGAIIKMK